MTYMKAYNPKPHTNGIYEGIQSKFKTCKGINLRPHTNDIYKGIQSMTTYE